MKRVAGTGECINDADDAMKDDISAPDNDEEHVLCDCSSPPPDDLSSWMLQVPPHSLLLSESLHCHLSLLEIDYIRIHSTIQDKLYYLERMIS